MKLKKALPPFSRTFDSVGNMMASVLVPLLLLLVIPVFHYGWRPAVMAGAAMLACALSEILFCLLFRREIRVLDCSALVTGILIAELLPVNIPLQVLLIACVFAIFVVKMPFGGTGHTPFNPAAAGIAFVTLCFPTAVFSYKDPRVAEIMPPFSANVEVATAQSPAALLKMGARPSLLWEEMITGKMAGPMGTTAAVVILAAALFLLFRRLARVEAMASFVAVAVLLAAIFPRGQMGRLGSVAFEVLSGSLIFCAVFLIAEPATSPKLPLARCLYGFLGGLFLMLFRYFGAFEQGGCFAVLLVNALSAPLDQLCWRMRERRRKRREKALESLGI